MLTVVAVNVRERLALLSDGRTVPIVTLFDQLGDETDSAFHAKAFVAGADREWFSDDLATYERQTTQ